MNVIDIQDLASRLCQKAKGGQTVYAVCPSRTRNTLSLALLSNLKEGDRSSGLVFSVGKGAVHMVRPNDQIPADGYTVGLVAFSEADGLETKGMLAWRDKAAQVVM